MRKYWVTAADEESRVIYNEIIQADSAVLALKAAKLAVPAEHHKSISITDEQSTDSLSIPAFPTNRGDCDEGMTLRDYFAAKALGGMMADPNVTVGGDKVRHIAELAYELADAMLAARGAA